MSAWAIGRTNGQGTLAGGQGLTLKSFVDKTIKWIPADVIALYTLGITALKTQHPDPNPSVALLIGALVLAPILVILGAVSARSLNSSDYVLAALSVVAFAIWSLAIPDSGWHRIDWVVANPGYIAVISAVAGLLFGIIADSVTGNS